MIIPETNEGNPGPNFSEQGVPTQRDRPYSVGVDIPSVQILGHGSVPGNSKVIYTVPESGYAHLAELYLTWLVAEEGFYCDLLFLPPNVELAATEGGVLLVTAAAHAVWRDIPPNNPTGPHALRSALGPRWKVALATTSPGNVGYHLSGVEIV